MDIIAFDLGLTALQARFCVELIEDMNIPAAAKRAGFTRVAAYSALKHPSVRKYLDALLSESEPTMAAKAAWAMKRLEGITDTDLYEILSPEGYEVEGSDGEWITPSHAVLRNPKSLTKAQRLAIKEMTVKRVRTEYGTETSVTVKLHDRLAAIRMKAELEGLLSRSQAPAAPSVVVNILNHDPSSLPDDQLREWYRQNKPKLIIGGEAG